MTTPLQRATRPHVVELGALTAAKTVSNAALRWVGPFLPTLERAFDSTTGTLTGIMGVCELGGLTTIATGPTLDRGHERRVFTLGLLAVAVSCLVALVGTTTWFAVSFAILVLGVSNLTVAGHVWIGQRVPFAARARSIGVFETSWAFALLLGAPVIAVVIDRTGWRGPYVMLAVATMIAALGVRLMVSGRSSEAAAAARQPVSPLPGSAWLPMLASASTAAAGLGTFVVSGAWLDDVHRMSTGGLGVIAAGFGVVELASSSAVATVGDRIGARRSVLIGLTFLLAGALVMAVSGPSRTLAVVGLLVLVTGFEFGFVSSLTLVTEAAPLARGRAIGISNACGTLARASAVVASGQLYEAFGIRGSLVLVAAAATTAVGLTELSRPGRAS